VHDYFPNAEIVNCRNHLAKNFSSKLFQLNSFCTCQSKCKKLTTPLIGKIQLSFSNLIAQDISKEEFAKKLRNFPFHYADLHDGCENHPKEVDGKPYHSEKIFSCSAVFSKMKEVIEEVINNADDYLSSHGRVTTNVCEAMGGLAIHYRNKMIPLRSTHYSLKTNAAFLHKNVGPAWKMEVLKRLHLEPAPDLEALINKVHAEHLHQKTKRSSPDYLKKKAEEKKKLKARRTDERLFSETLIKETKEKQEFYKKEEMKEGEEGEGESHEGLQPSEEESDPGVLNPEFEQDEKVDKATLIPKVIGDLGDIQALWILLFDLETTGRDPYNDQIIQTTAIDLHGNSFNRFSNSWKSFDSGAQELHKDKMEMVRNSPFFDKVVKDFFTWIEQGRKGRSVVLLAHNGFKFDFPVLYNELKRRALLHLLPEYIHFGDTIVWIKELKRRREIPDALQNGSLSLENLYKSLFQDSGELSFHNSLDDCRALSKIVFESDLKASVDALPVQTYGTFTKQMFQTEKMYQKR